MAVHSPGRQSRLSTHQLHIGCWSFEEYYFPDWKSVGLQTANSDLHDMTGQSVSALRNCFYDLFVAARTIDSSKPKTKGKKSSRGSRERMRKAAVYRNIFAYEDEDPTWRAVLSKFPNHVPRFEDKASATAFTQTHCLTHSNPDYPQLQHSVTTLIDWKQIETVLLPRIREYERRWPSSSAANSDSADSAQAVDEMAESVHNYARSRLNLKIHREMSEVSRMNTLRYLFFHMKCGIYVMIRNNALVIFAPFVNKDYKNSWRGELRIGSMDGTVESYVEEKASYYRGYKMHYLDMSAWWANGNIICNDYGGEEAAESNQFWGDHFLLQLKDMFAELCRTRKVPDCEFFINKRDYPQLKYNGSTERAVEPYGFIFDRDDRKEDEDLPLRRYCYSSYAPIM